MQRERLQEQFTKALDNFQRAQRSAAQKEKDAIKKYKNQGVSITDREREMNKLFNTVTLQLPPPGESNLIDIEGGGGATRSQMLLMQEEEQNLEQLVERERAVKQIEADIMDVNQIFKDLAAMVHDQGDMVESIEANVEESSTRITEGTQQLLEAERWQVIIEAMNNEIFI